MTSERHAKLHRLFTAARRIADATARRAFLDEECREDSGLRAEVEALIAADAEDSGFLDATAGGAEILAEALANENELGPAATPPPSEKRLGKYRVLRLIAEGGMGAVYEAEHDDSKRRVALKIIRPSLVSPELLHRFRREVRLLGQLHHPGIAQIHDAGTDISADREQPYFAMELVEGIPLDRFADKHELDTNARLELIARVCDALQHAHEKGVVHRDLKPANILVENQTAPSSASGRGGSGTLPQPKILDFGVARATDADLQTVTLHTSEGQLIGTVPYMSPE